MAFAVVHHFPGGTKEQYEAMIAAVHRERGKLPKGQIFHAGGPFAGGWSIVAVHKTRKSWEKFRDGTLVPAMQKKIPGGFTTQPQEMCFEAENFQK